MGIGGGPRARAWRLLAALGVLYGLIAPGAAHAAGAVTATWQPRVLRTADLAGRCPIAGQPEAPCPLRRGVTYRTTVRLTVNRDAGPMGIVVDPGGIEIEATSPTTGQSATPPLLAGESAEIELAVTLPPGGRVNRTFYVARLRLVGADAPVRGTLVVALAVPRPRVTWGRPVDPATGEPTPGEASVPANGTFTRTVTLQSNLDVDGLELRASHGVRVEGAPARLHAGVPAAVTISYDAPLVNRRARASLRVVPLADGRAIGSALRLPVTVLPVEARWSQPRVVADAPSDDGPPTIGVAVTTNYDVFGVRFRTADPGLMPIVSPARPVDLEAGEPQMVAIELCPGYAPTTYFLSVIPRAGTLPLRRLLPVMVHVEAPANHAAASVPCGEPKDEATHDLFNCAHFGAQADAQRFLLKYPHDPSRLDADNDNVACEDPR